MRTLLPLLLAALIAPAAAQTPPTKPAPDVALFDQVWQTVNRRFYDRGFHGVDWAAMRTKYRPRAQKAKTRQALFDVINTMIGELKASHCCLMEGEVYRTHLQAEFRGRPTLRNGFELEPHDGKFFVNRLYEGCAAARAGLKLGDEVVTINGHAPRACPDLLDAGSDPGLPGGQPHYVIRCYKDRPIKLTVRPTADADPRPLTFVPDAISLVQASRNSVRVIDVNGWKIGYLHQWHYMSYEILRIMNRALSGPLKDVDGLVLDIRGRGGNVGVMNAVFNRIRRQYKKPVVCLVDEGSRSAKDVFAWMWKRHSVGPLIGRKTAGAVIASTFIPVRDDAVLMLAIMNVDRLSGGERLEGKGVEPTINVPGHYRYVEGKDAILEKGVEVLMRKVRRTY